MLYFKLNEKITVHGYNYNIQRKASRKSMEKEEKRRKTHQQELSEMKTKI